ncbi:uncharacterized protein UV8b_06139 [Ustilaginoidea virens]|uniref:Uncharacterized protein n=1 Tax=Ustilaginoidea virens TaxID=1159556 RepID=A0A8E5HUR3_USTVR|nr:uncharacterized protein UV8b_06139 [Ustilaginoidea virens]QUC21898.1 hypothetical protein UV8b_06139 [Ustilaginoidea virens]
MPKVALLVGPPPAAAVTEAACSVASFGPPFRQLLGVACAAPAAAASPSGRPAWRSLPLRPAPPPPHTGPGLSASCRDASLLAGASDDLLTQFCEQSLATAGSSPDRTTTSLASSSSSSSSASASYAASGHEDAADAPARAPRHLSDLEDVPSAARLVALQPQTVTLNLIVGVLAVASARAVTSRWGRPLALVEVLVGDDTAAAAFPVTFWVSGDDGHVDGHGGDSHVGRLRRQDVVLLDNVALRVFRGKVHGQSLPRGLTRLRLLWRADGSGFYSSRGLRAGGGGNPQRDKARAVKDWLVATVASDRGEAGEKSSWDRPPADTPS